MSRGSRLAIWSIALLLSLSLYMKGRVPTGKNGGAAFFRPREGAVAVRLSGDFPRPGVYHFPAGTTAPAAIKMTVPDLAISAVSVTGSAGALSPGDIVTLSAKSRKSPVFTVGKMKARERMLLAIPLDVDHLEQDEWDYLPGIGPVLAAKIVADRHNNGAFGSIEALMRVPGIGPAKVAAIRQYFAQR